MERETEKNDLTTRAHELRAQGLTYAQIGEALGVSETSAHRAIRKSVPVANRQKRTTSLNVDAVMAFLDSITHTRNISSRGGGRHEAVFIGGMRLDDYTHRTIRQWKAHGQRPTFFALDRLLVRMEIHIDRYFDFCEEEGLTAWAGEKPEWA